MIIPTTVFVIAAYALIAVLVVRTIFLDLRTSIMDNLMDMRELAKIGTAAVMHTNDLYILTKMRTTSVDFHIL